MKYRKRPVVIDAVQLTTDNGHDLAKWCAGSHSSISNAVVIHTLEGTLVAQVGDWIIRGVAGEHYPCKPDIFAATYEPVEEARDG